MDRALKDNLKISSTTVLSVSVFVIAIFLPNIAAAFEFNSVEFGFNSDSNPARAQFRDDILSSRQASVGLNASLLSIPAKDDGVWSVFGSGSVEISGVFLEDSRRTLGRNDLQLSLEFERSLSSLPGQPILVLGGGAGYIDSITNIRDSRTVGVSVSLSYQPLPVLDLTFGLRHDERFAENAVFDTSKTQIFSSAFFGITPKLGLLAEAQLITGNEVSTATPTVEIVNQADVIVPDNAFGGFAERRFAYLLDATSVLGSFGVSYVLPNNILADSKLTYVFTDAVGDIDYSRWILSFGLTMNFE